MLKKKIPRIARTNTAPNFSFDFVKVLRSKEVFDISPSTIKSWSSQGLKIYKVGNTRFVSRLDVAAFIRNQA